LVPPNWDSWAKIRILREGFDVEGVSERWSIDIEIPRHMRIANGQAPAVPENGEAEAEPEPSPVIEEDEDGPSATSIYEDTIRNPETDFPLSGLSKQANGVEVTSKDPQGFLGEQVTLLEQLRREDENEAAMKAARKESDTPAARTYSEEASGVVEEHIGPVQFNMGGIQVNADEMVKRLQVRHKHCSHPTRNRLT
jgi:dynein light intermediate chain 1